MTISEFHQTGFRERGRIVMQCIWYELREFLSSQCDFKEDEQQTLHTIVSGFFAGLSHSMHCVHEFHCELVPCMVHVNYKENLETKMISFLQKNYCYIENTAIKSSENILEKMRLYEYI